MRKLIITDRDQTLFFEKDGVLSSDIKDAKVFNSEKQAEQKSVELQLAGNPVHWINIKNE